MATSRSDVTILVVTQRDGTQHTVPARSGYTVMELVRAAGIDELLALCGGCLSCATCHVYVEPRDFERLPPMGAEEGELLSALEHRRATSRLACQIQLTEDLEGLRVTVAEEY
jgi:ferredoxin, 2Fe-2S